jgi:ATP-dependent helicase/nuclease subunit A
MQSPSSPLVTKAIRAGAGAGKTYTLTHEVIRQALLFKQLKQRWPRFVVTTFTKKATQELSERLLALALQEYPDAMEFVSSSTHLKISTIHGVLDELLKEFGYLVGLKSDFSYLRESEALFISKKTLKDIYEQKTPDFLELFQVFSFSQVHHLLRLSLSQDIAEYQSLSLAVSMKILEQHLVKIKKRCEAVVLDISQKKLPPKWETVKDTLQRIQLLLNLQKWAEPQPALQEIDSFDLRGGLKSKTQPDSLLLYEDLKELVKDLRDLAQPAFQIATIVNLSKYNEQFARLQREYKLKFDEHKKQISRIEMNDLELISLQLVREHAQDIRSWTEKKDYWFIDEFQDTSPQQMILLKEFISARPYYIVGDPQQSIYLFRGARSEVFAEQFQKVEMSGGEVHRLQSNYRSRPSLLEFINLFAKTLGENFATMTPAKQEDGLIIDDVVLFIGEKTEDSSKVSEELLFLLKTIQDLHASGVSLDKMAILVRKNKDLEEIGQFLSLHGLPIHLHSSGLFWQRREVRAAIQLLKFLIYPNDDENLFCLLRCPFITVTDQNLVDLALVKKGSLWQRMREGAENGAYLRSGRILCDAQKEKRSLGLVIAFEKALLDLGFYDFHKHQDPTGRAEGNLWKFVGLLKNFERERGAAFVQFIQDCENAIDSESSIDSPGSIEKNKVSIMTVHASKGLQFEHVFLPFLGKKPYLENQTLLAIDEKQKRWSIRAPANESEVSTTSSLFEKQVLDEKHQRQQQEDLRVLYVAITRAIRSLYLSWTNPIAESSWAQKLKFLEDIDNSPSLGFRLKKFSRQELTTPEVDFAKSCEQSSIRSRFLDISLSMEPVKSQAVTQLVSRSQKSYRAAYVKKQQGILFHKLIEIIKYPVPKDLPLLLKNWFGESQEEVLAALNYILTLQEPPVVTLMKEGSVEWAFRWKKEEQFIDGQVDLWCVHANTLWIVDYKSGEKILLDKAFAQLSIYAEAIQKYLDWQGPVKAAVIYPFLKTTMVRDL